ncbi:hypothetical protein DPMN_085904 [Dreissena polymorpha]|uniref:eIF3h C-terminal domain-containing protein n=1 Tax=Dreissena polymorpha TaxID=45954 RepID=A0A9D3YGX1_DREPO|nr:hypothetical protein DPMN_085904 [Dreissena polymorpha]
MLEKNLRLLMESVDEVAMDANKFVNFQRQLQKQNMLKQQHIQKRVSNTGIWDVMSFQLGIKVKMAIANLATSIKPE